MNFDDVYKSMLLKRGGSVLNSDIKNSKDSINNQFKNDPSYKLATLKKKDITIDDSDLDTRIVNVDTDVYKKKIYVRPDTNIEAGDYIIYPNKTYLVLSVEDNLVSPYANSTFCNYILKWMYKGVLYKMPVIISNQTKYTLGVSTQVAGISEGTSRYQILTSYNNLSKVIDEGQRFLFNNNAWKTTQVDFISEQGLLSMLLGQDSINTEIDNLDLEVAGYYANNHTYTYNIPTSFEVSKDNTYQLSYSIINELGKDFDYSLVNITTTNNTLVNITNDKGIITIKGIEIGIGSVKLSVPIGEITKDFDINFEVKAIVADKIEYKYDFKLGTTIKQYVTDLVTISRFKNGIQDNTLKINYSFDTNTQTLINSKKIIITKVSDSNFTIKNALVTVKTIIYVTVNDVDTGTKVLDNFPLTLINGI